MTSPIPRGRPLKFESVEVLQEQVDAYFTNTPEKEWTVTGLALALDTSRETLMNYEERPEYVDVIRKAKEMVHNAYEKDLRKQGRSGDIFALKNFGWTDKQEIDHTTGGGKIENTTYILGLTAQLNALHRGSGFSGNGELTGIMGIEAPDQERSGTQD